MFPTTLNAPVNVNVVPVYTKLVAPPRLPRLLKIICVFAPGATTVPEMFPIILPIKELARTSPVTFKLASVPTLVILGCAAVLSVPVIPEVAIILATVISDASPITKGVLKLLIVADVPVAAPTPTCSPEAVCIVTLEMFALNTTLPVVLF